MFAFQMEPSIAATVGGGAPTKAATATTAGSRFTPFVSTLPSTTSTSTIVSSSSSNDRLIHSSFVTISPSGHTSGNIASSSSLSSLHNNNSSTAAAAGLDNDGMPVSTIPSTSNIAASYGIGSSAPSSLSSTGGSGSSGRSVSYGNNDNNNGYVAAAPLRHSMDARPLPPHSVTPSSLSATSRSIPSSSSLHDHITGVDTNADTKYVLAE
jgi:hypothetical protein